MPFHPQVNQELTINDVAYRIAAHPAVPGIPYGQEGRQATVYQAVTVNGEQRALKVFKSRFQIPALVGRARRLAPFAQLPGLSVCGRIVLTPQHDADLLRQHPDLTYAVLMPWISGPTWLEVVLDGRENTPAESMMVARSLAEILAGLEQEGLAHCDLSGPNLLLPALQSAVGRRQSPEVAGVNSAIRNPQGEPYGLPQSAIELVDVEQLYGPGLERPETVPAGSPGYAHRTAGTGLWGSPADRFAGAVLLAEMLGWCDSRVRAAAWGESYFDPSEMQQPGDRARLLTVVLRERWGSGIATLFERAWRSDLPAGCPTFGEWLVTLPVPAHDATGAQVSGTATGGASSSLTVPPATPRFSAPIREELLPDDLPVPALRRPTPAIEAGYDGPAPPAMGAAGVRAPMRRPALLAGGATVFLLLLGVAFWQLLPGFSRGTQPESATVLPTLSPPSTLAPTGTALLITPSPVAPQAAPITAVNATQMTALDWWGKGPVGSVAWSADGRLLAVASSHGVYLYDPVSLSQVRFLEHPAQVHGITFSPDGRLLATAGADGLAYLWQVADGRLAQTLPHRESVDAVAFSADSQLLATATHDERTVRIWQIAGGQPRVLAFFLDHQRVQTLVFAPNDQILASGTIDGRARLWRVADGQLLFTLDGARTRTLAFSPDSSLVAAGGDEHTVRMWKTADGTLTRTLKGHTGDVHSVAFSPNGTSLASGSMDGTVRLWNLSEDTPSGDVIWGGGLSSVENLSFNPDGTRLVSGSGDNIVRVWYIGDPRPPIVLSDFTAPVRAIARSTDGTTVAAGYNDGKVQLWDLRTGHSSRVLSGHTAFLLALAFSPDGRLLASGGADSTIRLVQVDDGSLVRVLTDQHGAVTSLAFSPDGALLASGSEDNVTRLHAVSDGRLVRELKGHTDNVLAVAFSPDGAFLASGSSDHTIRIWRIADGSVIRTLGQDGAAGSVAFSPDGTLLATSDNLGIHLWRTNDSSTMQNLQIEQGQLTTVAFNQDGTLLAAGSTDQQIRLWQVSDGRLVQTLSGHTSWISGLTFSTDGSRLLSGSIDGTVGVWGIR